MTPRSIGRAVTLCVLGLVVLRPPVVGQELRGRVLEAGGERRVGQALVRLLDNDEAVRGTAVSDSAGIYSLSTPGPGDYRLTVEAFGYAPFQSHLLAVGERESYRVDIEMTPTPLPMSGFVVSADRFEELEQGLRLEIGVHPRSLRYRPIMRPEIEDHIERAHGLTELVRWSNTASIITRETPDGPCFQWRNRQCMSVYLNGAKVAAAMIPVLPLNMMEMIVIMTPGDSIVYPGGAVLLYTSGWVG